MNVKLRQRQKGDKISLYLDYYHQGNRQYEYLQLYLIPNKEKGKLTKEQKEQNRATLELAENIRAKRQLEIQSGIYGFEQQSKLKGSFLRYFEYLTEKRKDSDGNHGNWLSTLKHLKNFVKKDVTFSQVDVKWLEDFKNYLNKEALTKSKTPLQQNTKNSYFNKIKAALNAAHREGIILKNPVTLVTGIKAGETQREFLTVQELQSLADTECELPLIKNAFIFSALTGLRWSDIQKLTWSQVQYSEENGYYIRFVQKKTKGVETLPISEQSISLLGERKDSQTRVFVGLVYSVFNNQKLAQWVINAGITKKITFHCARHTFAVLQLSFGTDIYTVSKMLGHKDLKTTQIYAKVIDQKKQKAAKNIENKIKL